MGPISRAMRCGAASTIARAAGAFSHSTNAAPFLGTSGPKAHIHPNPRGRHSSGGTAPRTAGMASHVAPVGARTTRPGFSPASIRRISAESARSRADSHRRGRPRITGEIAISGALPRAPRVCSAAGRATRRRIAFTRSSRGERNGAENIVWSFSERRAHFARRHDLNTHPRWECQLNRL
jgi:hypothetical protein